MQNCPSFDTARKDTIHNIGDIRFKWMKDKRLDNYASFQWSDRGGRQDAASCDNSVKN